MRARHASLLVLPLVLFAIPARAQTDKARALFTVGMAAYNSANYADAIRAFEDAYQADPRAGLLFSMAQAHRKQYAIDHQPEHLHKAVKLYRDYLAKNEGTKRAEAAAALEELDPIEQRLGGATGDAATQTPAAPSKPKLMASSDAQGATLSIDGGAAKPLPISQELSPGPHKFVVSAQGYFDATRDIQAPDTGIVPLDVTLKEKPALLDVKGEGGMSIAVDGRPVGTTPLAANIELTPGKHFVAITKSGAKAVTEEIDVAHGEVKTIDARPPRTAQRYVSYACFGVGAGALVAGGVLAGASFAAQTNAQKFLDQKSQGEVTSDALAQYDSDKANRDAFKRDAAIVAGAGGGVIVVGLLLYAFDQPVVELPNRGEDRTTTPTKHEEQKMELTGALPILAPGFVGGSLRGSF